MRGCAAECIWRFRRRRFRTCRRVRRAPGPHADAGGTGGGAAHGRARGAARRELQGVRRRWGRRTTPQNWRPTGGGGGGERGHGLITLISVKLG